MKLTLFTLVGMLVFSIAFSASAQFDRDMDLVPDAFDNCEDDPNGPAELSNQIDTDLDGYGNACDPDYDNDFSITVSDFGAFLGTLGSDSQLTDHDGDGSVTVGDFAVFLSFFGGLVGPSGLSCAGIELCAP